MARRFLTDGDEDINADGDPDLRFDGTLVGAEKRFDAQVLLDPFEKQLDLPATFVKLCNDQSWKFKIVGEEAKALVRFLVVESDIAQILRIVVGRFYARETNGLIATQACLFIDSPRIDALKKSVAFWADDEERSHLRQAIQSRKIEKPAIHNREASGLWRYQVEHVHLMHFSIRNMDK